jgi:phosphomevalonate kinase
MWFHPIITRASTMGLGSSMGIVILIFMTLVASHFGFHDINFKVWM